MQFASKYLRPAGLSMRLRSSASGRLFFSSLSLQELPRPISSHRLTNLSVEFLGTGSFSTRYRFSSAVSLHLERKDTWLFDAPDGTLRQTNLIADRNFCHVQKIFISSFVTDTFHGLPNLIIGRLMSALQSKIAKKPIDVYGPPGLVKYLNATLPLSVRPEFHSHFSLLTVHELVLDDELISDLDKHQRMQFKWAEEYANRLQQRAFKGAADESVEPSLFNTRQIHRDPTTNTWILAEEEKATLVAGLVGAAQPVFGFVFHEHDYCDKISADMVSDLKDKYVLNVDDLQRVKTGETIEVRRRGGDPTQLESLSLETLNLHRHEGRKVVIVTAGSDATTLAGIGADCDVLVHPLSIRDDRQQDALDHSMATPTMCVQAAAAMRAHRLVPTRLSSHQSEEITDAMNLWTSKCDRVAGHLYFAKDGLLVTVPREGYHRDDLHKGLEVEFPLFSQFRTTDTSHRRPTRYEGQATVNNIPPRNRGLAMMSHGNAIVNMLADHTFAPDEPAPAAGREHTQSAAAQSRPLKAAPKLHRGPPASGGDAVVRRKHTNSSAAAGASAASS